MRLPPQIILGKFIDHDHLAPQYFGAAEMLGVMTVDLLAFDCEIEHLGQRQQGEAAAFDGLVQLAIASARSFSASARALRRSACAGSAGTIMPWVSRSRAAEGDSSSSGTSWP